MEQKRPRGREKHVTDGGLGVNKRGEGLGSGPVGKGSSGSFSGNTGSNTKRALGGSSILIIVVILYFLFGRNAGLGSVAELNTTSNQSGMQSMQSATESYTSETTTEAVDTTVAEGSREKRTKILGNGDDKITIMVYMCGTDLESKSGMATSDLNEMLAANISDNVNLIVYTGGCSKWNNNIVSSRVNQIYRIHSGRMECLEADMGAKVMTKPETLTEFIKYCDKNFEANRKELIFWDHGGGSISGYGYDEKNASSGSMNLAGINKALKDSGVKFDFIGFDACLMATLENGLMLEQYADYMIASEETEPGVGWYYTNFLSEISKNTSIPTVSIGKRIIDDFVDVCNQKCRGQKTTLSVVDLCELKATVPTTLTEFAKSTNDKIKLKEYLDVSKARNNTREFAQSSKIDQIDLVHFCKNLGTDEGAKLSEALLGAVKYNRTASCITDAYGLSIYFPYKKAANVKNAIATYEQIGMDTEYSKCIKEFAGLEMSGQISTGGASSPLPSLLGSLAGGSISASGSNADMLTALLSGVLSDRSLSTEESTEFISNNCLDVNSLVFTKSDDAKYRIVIPKQQWDLVTKVDLNVFYDDGEGYVDLGLDNLVDYDEEGNLIADYDNTWISINSQPVAYYHMDTVEDGDEYSITGYVPVMLNGNRAELILVFDNDNPYGYIAGAKYVYANNETETVAKSLTEVVAGDKLEFICDYYSYEGEYLDSYYLGEPMILGEDVEISNTDIGEGKARVTYKFTDLYQNEYWTSVLPND